MKNFARRTIPGAYGYKTIFIPCQNFTGFTAAAAVAGAGAGAPELEESTTSGLTGVAWDAAGDELAHLWQIPSDFDRSTRLRFRHLFSSGETTTTDTFTFILTYAGVTPATDATTVTLGAADTAWGATANDNTAFSPQWTGYAIVNGGSLAAADTHVKLNIEIDAVSGATLGTDEVIGWGLEISYYPLVGAVS